MLGGLYKQGGSGVLSSGDASGEPPSCLSCHILIMFVGIKVGGIPGVWYQYCGIQYLVRTPDMVHCGGLQPTK